jgi:hypothetical protein
MRVFCSLTVERSRYAAEEREPNEASHGDERVVMFFGVDFPDLR